MPLNSRGKRLSVATSVTSSNSDTPKVSKWTKVKAAFKWERAGVGTSTLSGVVTGLMEQEAQSKLHLKPRDMCDTHQSSPTPSVSSLRTPELSGPPSPATLSSSSSMDDIYNKAGRKEMNNIDTLAHQVNKRKDNKSDQNIQFAAQNLEILSTEPMIKPRLMVTSESSNEPTSKPLRSAFNRNSEIIDLASRRLTPTLTITVPSSEELRSASSPESLSPMMSSRNLDSASTGERSASEDMDSPKTPAIRGSRVFSREIKRIRQDCEGLRTVFNTSKRVHRSDSKWNKVKRAFLTNAGSVPPSPSRTSFFDETDNGGTSYSASAEELDNGRGSPIVQTEIQRNYQILHDKLSVEFHRKLVEWKKMKNSQNSQHSQSISPEMSSSTSRPRSGYIGNSPKEKDFANALLMGEEQLTPEFKKKLQEWQKLKKGLTTNTTSPENQIFRRRLTDWQIWKSSPKSECKNAVENEMSKIRLSEDFLKKMDQWKRIKAGKSDEEQTLTFGRRGSTDTIKGRQNDLSERCILVDENEFQPLDRMVAMLEREQRDTEKLKHSLKSKLTLNLKSRVVNSSENKKEVLVQTPTGSYRFQGISQEFTKKLYEWEKSRGIAPESSTFNFLNSSYRTSRKMKNISNDEEMDSVTIKRAKSIGSVADYNIRNEMQIREPSSLSLNDVIQMEIQNSRINSKPSSKQTVGEEEILEELGAMDDSEPEAVIVDIEDLIEETASPIAKLQPQQTPVYCVMASETTSIAVPLGTVSAMSQEPPVVLVQPGEIYPERKHMKLQSNTSSMENKPASEIDDHNNKNKTTNQLEDVRESFDGTVRSCYRLKQDKLRPRERPTSLFLNTEIYDTPRVDNSCRKPNEVLLAEKNKDVSNESNQASIKGNTQDVVITVKKDARPNKILKTRRLTDTQVGYKWQHHQQQKDQLPQEKDSQISISSKDEPTKTDTFDNPTVSTYCETPSIKSIIINESTLNKIVVPTATNEHISEMKKITREAASSPAENTDKKPNKIDSKSVFIKTKRIIFSPFSRRNSKDKASPISPEVCKIESKSPTDTAGTSSTIQTPPIQNFQKVVHHNLDPPMLCQKNKPQELDPKRPPLPQSPILSRKEYCRSSPKETAPSIRIMIQRYNQKLQEDASSPASSGSGSPIWRSPTSERRVRMQMEKYQEEVRKALAGTSGKDVQKSASTGLIGGVDQIERKPISSPNMCQRVLKNEILKSTSADFVKNSIVKSPESTNLPNHGDAMKTEKRAIDESSTTYTIFPPANIKLPGHGSQESIKRISPTCELAIKESNVRGRLLLGNISPELIHKLNSLSNASQRFEETEAASENTTPLRIRAQKIKKAKEDFLSRGPTCYSHEPSVESYRDSTNSNISMDSLDSNDLIKSASAGMINVDSNTFKKVSSDTADTKPEKNGIEAPGRLSQIANKFRRVKLRKPKEKVSAIQALCRQSLLVDIQGEGTSKSCPTSPAPAHREDDDYIRYKHY